MLGGLISYSLLAALATALLVAAVTDLRRREIDNWLNAGIALAAPLYWLAAGLDWVAVLFQLGLMLITFLLAFALYAARQMGGGDVKLLTALALWFPPGSFVQLIVIMGVVGGAASVAMGVFNMRRSPQEALRNGLATFAASVWVMGTCAVGFAAATGRPLITPDATATMTAVLPGGMMLAVLAAMLAGALMVGMGHIFRRQRGAIPIPYGVAISAAALWVLLQNQVFPPLSGAVLG